MAKKKEETNTGLEPGGNIDPVDYSPASDPETGTPPTEDYKLQPEEALREDRLENETERQNAVSTDDAPSDEENRQAAEEEAHSEELPDFEATTTHEAINMVLTYPDRLLGEIQWAKENVSEYALMRIRENLIEAAKHCI